MSRLSSFLKLVPALALAFSVVAAQASAADWLVGRWSGGGQHMGKNSNAELTVAPALGGRFLELSYRVTNPIQFEGRGLYRENGEASLSGHWFDSRGVEMPLKARRDATSMVADWGHPDGERGRTHYLLQADGSLEVVDEVRTADGGYQIFARQRFTRSQ